MSIVKNESGLDGLGRTGWARLLLGGMGCTCKGGVAWMFAKIESSCSFIIMIIFFDGKGVSMLEIIQQICCTKRKGKFVHDNQIRK